MAFDRRKLSIVNIGGSVETPNIFAYTTRPGAEDKGGEYYPDYFGVQLADSAGKRRTDNLAAADILEDEMNEIDNVLAKDYFRGEDEDDLYTKVKFNTGDYIFITAATGVKSTSTSGTANKLVYQDSNKEATRLTPKYSMQMFGIEVTTSGNIKLIGGSDSGAPDLDTDHASGAAAT